jgi:acetyltransferase
VIYSPKLGGDPAGVARAVSAMNAGLGKPLLTCWMGDEQVAEARQIINTAGGHLPHAGSGRRWLQQYRLVLPEPATAAPDPATAVATGQADLDGARLLIESVLAERRKVLTEMESKALLAAFHIPITQTILARTASEAMLIASQLGYPVALKIDSPDIPHKSDVQGVVLNVQNAAAVRDAFSDMMATVRRLQPDARINGVTMQKMAGKRHGRELYIGVATDHLFGPVIGFGAGGTMIELINDRAVELPPLNQFLAQRLIDAPVRPKRWANGAARRPMRGHRTHAAARIGNGVRTAAAARDGYQPAHRR